MITSTIMLMIVVLIRGCLLMLHAAGVEADVTLTTLLPHTHSLHSPVRLLMILHTPHHLSFISLSPQSYHLPPSTTSIPLLVASTRPSRAIRPANTSIVHRHLLEILHAACVLRLAGACGEEVEGYAAAGYEGDACGCAAGEG